MDVDVFPELVAERGMCFSLHTNDGNCVILFWSYFKIVWMFTFLQVYFDILYTDSTSVHELSPLLTDGKSVSKSSTFTECNESNETSAFPSKRPRLDDSKHLTMYA